MCTGGAKDCPEAVDVLCRACGAIWQPADKGKIGACPACGVKSWVRQRCEGCVKTRLDAAMDTPSGFLFLQAAQILSDIELGLGCVHDLDSISCATYDAINVIRNERELYKVEVSNRPPQ